jgi:hypothetical protein
MLGYESIRRASLQSDLDRINALVWGVKSAPNNDVLRPGQHQKGQNYFPVSFPPPLEARETMHSTRRYPNNAHRSGLLRTGSLGYNATKANQ